MKDILISTAIILFIGIAGSLLFQALTAPHMPVTGTLMHPTMSHNAAFATRPAWALPAAVVMPPVNDFWTGE